MNIQVDSMIIVTDGDLQLRIGKALSIFAYKGQDKFVFRTSELSTLCQMAKAGTDMLNKTEAQSATIQ